MTSTLALVSCVKLKADTQSAARDLYVSPLFRLSRRYAEQHAQQWFILSAQYGLLHPDRIVEPYDLTLSKMKAHERREWYRMVVEQIEDAGLRGDRVIVLAGEAYRSGLLPFLKSRFDDFEIPMQGLMFGQQLQWLSNART